MCFNAEGISNQKSNEASIKKIKTMNEKLICLILIGVLIFGCQKDEFDRNSLLSSEGLNLWWNHKIFGEEGRGFVFEFYEAQRFENFYELIFEYKIDNKQRSIDIYLIDKIDEGKCPVFPSPNKTDNLCISDGDFFIPENSLKSGDYTFTVRTFDFSIQSNFLISENKVSLEIPENQYFSCSIKDVFPTPTDLLYGSVIFNGEEKTEFANEFFEKLKAIGLKDTIVSNPPFNLNVDETGKTIDRHWEPDKHSLSFLYSMDISFRTIFELSKEHFNKYDLNIYLFSSNGDQASLSKRHGINVVYVN